MADQNDTNSPNTENSGSGENAQQALDDLTVLQNVENQTLGDTRLNVARPVDVSDTSLGNLANVQQGSRSAPQVQDVGAITGGVSVALDVAIESTQGGTTKPVELESTPVDTVEETPVVEIEAQSAKPLNVRAFDDLARPDETFKPQELPEGRPTEVDAPDGVVTGGIQQAVVEEAPVVEEAEQQETINTAPDAPEITIDTGEAENVSPELTGASLYSLEDTPRSFRFGVSASDADGDTLTFAITNPAHGSITQNASGEYIYNLEGDWNGTDSFTVTVDDGNGHSVSKTFSVNIEGMADGATITSVDSVFIQEGGQFGLDLNVVDAHYNEDVTGVSLNGAPMGTTLTIGDEVIAQNADGSFSLSADQANSPNLSIKPPEDFWGKIDLVVEATAVDHGAQLAEHATAITSRTISIEVNAPPEVADQLASVDQASTITGTISAVDPDSEALTYHLVDATGQLVDSITNEHGTITIDADTGRYTFTANDDTRALAAGESITDLFDIQVSDGEGGVTTASFDVTIDGANDGPEIEAVTLAGGAEDTSVIIRASDLLQGATDLDGDTLSVSSLSATHGTVVDNGDGTFTFTPDANYNGAVEFSYTVSDGNGGTATGETSIDLASVNDGPTNAGVDLGDMAEDGSITFTRDQLLANASDIDGDTLSVSNLSVANGQLTENADGTFTFTPDANFNGSVEVTYTVSDGQGGTVAGSATLDVNAVNDGPTVSGDVSLGAGTEDRSVTINARDLLGNASDVDGDTLSVSGLSASHGTITDNGDGTFTFTPEANYSGGIDLSYTVSDGQGGSTSASASFDLAADADAPILSASNISVDLGAGQAQTLSGTANADTISGGSGNDVINGGAGNDVIYGDGTGTVTVPLNISDRLTDTDGSESLSSVTISGLPAGATLSAGTQNADGSWTLSSDQLSGLTVTSTEGSNLHLTVSAGSVEASNGDTATTTTSFDVTFTGTAAGNDTLSGGAGSDLLDGGAGNDVLNFSADGSWSGGFVAKNVGDMQHGGTNETFAIAGDNQSQDVFRGGAGTDTIVMGSGNDALFLDDGYSASPTGGARIDGIESINAGDGNDVVDLTSNRYAVGDTAIDGGSGNDVLMASQGNDVIDGGSGNDYLYGASGNDTLRGGEGADTLNGGWGNDVIDGGAGNDTGVFVAGQGGSDVYDGGSGTDTFKVQLTAAQYTPAVHAELQQFEAFVANPANQGQSFHFNTLGVDAKNWEGVKVVVDGREVNLENAPTITNAPSSTTDEDHTKSATITAADSDPGDTVTYSLVDAAGNKVSSLTTEHGTVSLNATTGEYTFTPNADAQHMGVGASVTDSFKVVATDNHGVSSAASTVGVTITGSNDGPTVTLAGGSGTEDRVVTGTVSGHDIDTGDTMAYHVSGGVADGQGNEVLTTDHGTVSLNTSTGEYTFTPDANWSGNDSFSVTVSDGHGGSVTQAVNLNVDAVADAPELSLELGTGSSVTLPGETTEVTITSANMLAGDSGFSVSALKLDGSAGNLSSNQYGFGVAGGASGDSAELGQSRGSSEKIVVEFDNDVSSADVSFGWLASNEQAHYDLYKDGVKVGEGTVSGITDRVDPTISVSPTNGGSFDQIVFSAPSGGDNDYMINSISFQEAEPGDRVVDYPLNVTASLTDADGSESLAVSLNGLPEGAIIMDALGNVVGTDAGDGTWSLPGGQLDGLTLRVPADSEGFTLGATATSTESSNQASASTSVSVTVESHNNDPTVTLEGGTGTEDNAVTGQVVGADIDVGDTLGFHVDGGVSDGQGNELLTTDHGTVSLNTSTGEYTFTPNANWSGDDSFSVTVSDGNGGSVTQSVDVHVDAVADQASVSVAIGDGTVEPGGSFTVTNHDGEAGYHNTYGYYVMDDNGNPVSGEVIWKDVHDTNGQSVTIEGVDPDQVGFFIIPNGDQNGSIRDGSDISFSKDASGNWQVLDGNGRALSGTGTKVLFDNPALNSDRLTHMEDTSKDGGNQNWEDLNGGGDRDYNDLNMSVSWNEAEPTSTHPLTVSANFPDMDGSEGHTVTISGLPEGAVLMQDGVVLTPGADGSYALDPTDLAGLTVTTPAGFSGELSVDVTATAADGSSIASSSASAEVTLDLGNDGPDAGAAESVTTNKNVTVSGEVEATDTDGDQLNFSLATGNDGPQHGSVVLQPDGSFTYTPSTNFVGTDSFKVVIDDGHGGSTVETVSVTVASPNAAPVIDLANTTTSVSIDTYTGDGSAEGDVDATDANVGDAVSYHLVDAAGHQVDSLTTAHGTVTIDSATGEYVFTPAEGTSLGAGQSVVDTFSVVAVDNHGATSTPAEVSVRVTNSDIGPVATDDSAIDTVAQGAALSVDIGTVNVIEGTPAEATGWDGLDAMGDPTTAAATTTYGSDLNSALNFNGNTTDLVSVGRDNNSSISTGNGDDQVTIGRNVNAKLDLGNGNNALDVVDDVNASVSAGSGNDTVRVGDDLNARIDLGNGDNRLEIGGDANASISTGSGSDDVKMGGSLNTKVELGSGDDDLDVGGDANASIVAGEGDDRVLVDGDINSKVELGAGDDYLKVGDDAWASVDAGSGNDTVQISGDISSKVDMGSGDDHLTITGQNLWATVTGGSGTDSIELTGVTKAQWDANTNGIKGYVKDFENIKFSDGQVIGDASAFETEGGTPDTYQYPLTITATLNDTDGSESLSVVTLDNIPEGATLMQGDSVLSANQDGSYSVNVTSGQPVELTVVSNEPLDLSGMTTSVTSAEDHGGNTATVTVTGEGVNAGDTTADESIKVSEGGRLTISATDLLANDSDANGDALSITSVGLANHGTVSLDANGNIVFTADEGYSGAASFDYTVSDGHGGFDTARVSINVTDSGDDGQPIGWGNGGGRDESWGPDGSWTVGGSGGGSHSGGGHGNNGWGNGDQDAPGGSGDHNNGENGSGGGSHGGRGRGGHSGGGHSGGGHSGGGHSGGGHGHGGHSGGGHSGGGHSGGGHSGGQVGDVTYASDDASNWGNGWYAADVGNGGHVGSGDTISITGYNRHDEVYSGEAGETLVGTEGNDYMSLEGADGQQKIFGFDHIQLGDGDNVILDMTSTRYDYGDLTVAGGSGHDVIWSSSGDDLLVAGDGGNTIHGGGGEDTIVAGEGADLLMGQDGGDTFLFDFGLGHDTVNGGAGGNWTDTIDLSTNMSDGATMTISVGGNSWTVETDGDHQAAGELQLGQDKAGTITVHSDQGDQTIEFTNIESIKY
ncbi:hypothetical protein A6A04_09975 [Paramagnetospirillum marisnigri]|uniref:Cadherin domain-containing protein n=1 Tax=Paramagnetospirillum marisnigri TaxID=1285242 RepID=A0A178M6K2_9PROT|nr:cadherin-like domain-containing protein [Paramagnetospirillum marisnigri]OAN43014.1 hypothetical protein A6A04_09975 [Paramagnetospirillum marisnigri]